MINAPVTAARTFFHDSLSVFTTKMVVILLSLFSVVILAKALGPEGRGILALLLIYPQLFISIAEGGMRQATVYYTGQQSISDARIFGASIIYTLVSALIFSSLIVFMLSRSDDYDYTLPMMIAAALLLPVNLFMNAIRGVFLGKQHIRPFNTSQWLQKVVLVGLYAVLYALNLLTVETAVLCMLGAVLLGFLPALVFFFRNLFVRMEFSLDALWRMVRKGAVFAAALFLIEANYKLDILLLGWLSSSAEVGLYAVAVSMGEMLWQLPAAVGLVVFSRSANVKDPARWHGELARSVRISLWVTLLGALVLLIAAPLLFDILFGEDFSRAASMTLWLLPGLVLMVVFKLLNMDLAGKGKPQVSLFIMLPALALNVGLNYLLIPTLGGNGAAIASTISYLMAASAMLLVFCRMHELRIRDFLLIRPEDTRLLIDKFARKLRPRREA